MVSLNISSIDELYAMSMLVTTPQPARTLYCGCVKSSRVTPLIMWVNQFRTELISAHIRSIYVAMVMFSEFLSFCPRGGRL